MSAHSPASLSEDGGDSRKTPARPPSDPHRACKVCGDKANGYNFGVLTCESCKAFFRRNAAKENEISCPFSNACGITPASRRYCQACRLQKCVAVGMSRDWLQEQKTRPEGKKRPKREEVEADSNSEEEVSVSKAYLKELLRKAKGRPSSCDCTCTCGFYPSGTRLAPPASSLLRPSVATHIPLMPIPSVSEAHLQQRLVQATLQPEAAALFTLPSSSLALSSAALSSPGPSAFSPLALSQGPMSCDSQILSPPDPRISSEDYARLLRMSRKGPRLTNEEAELLEELVRVAQPLNSPLDVQVGDCAQMSLFDVVRITEYALRRIVCTARDLSAFKILPIEDRKTLMKGCASELLILRGVMAFDVHRNVWFHSVSQGLGPAMEVKLELLKNTAESPQHYEEHKRFLESFDDRVRQKEAVILVLMAVLIFQPERIGLMCIETVANTQAKYQGLLRHLLAVEFGESEAPSMYARLDANLRELRQLNQSLVRIYYGFDQRQLDPLLKELFDM